MKQTYWNRGHPHTGTVLKKCTRFLRLIFKKFNLETFLQDLKRILKQKYQVRDNSCNTRYFFSKKLMICWCKQTCFLQQYRLCEVDNCLGISNIYTWPYICCFWPLKQGTAQCSVNIARQNSLTFIQTSAMKSDKFCSEIDLVSYTCESFICNF